MQEVIDALADHPREPRVRLVRDLPDPPVLTSEDIARARNRSSGAVSSRIVHVTWRSPGDRALGGWPAHGGCCQLVAHQKRQTL